MAKKHNKKLLLLWLLLPIKAMAADVPVPADFAEGIHISPAGDSAVQYFEIPYSVYEGVTRKDRSDIAVFDADGQPVPWVIRQAQTSSRTEIVRDLPMFPLYSENNKNLKDLSLKIERNADGALVDIQAASDSAQTGTPSQKIAYLFDLQPIGESVDGLSGELKFDWSNPATDEIWRINLEGSTDLEYWETLVFEAVLTRLSYAGQTLIRNTVSFLPVADIKYLRMSWRSGQTPPDLTQANAKFQSHKTNPEWRFQTFKLSPVERADDKEGMNSYTFSTGGFVPVEKFSLELPDGNSFYKGKLYSRIDEQHDWALHGEVLQYRLRTHDAVLVNDEQTIRLTTDPQWLITFDEIPAHPLAMRIGWKAEYLHFLALGEAPYTLAYGNASGDVAEYSSDALKKLSTQDAQGTAAKLSEPFVLGGDEKRLTPEKPLPWRTILLWIVLIAGVAVMMWMALNLYRQMNSE